MALFGKRDRNQHRTSSYYGRIPPSLKVRVLLRQARQQPTVAWATNDLAYAKRLAQQLVRASAKADGAWVEVCNFARGVWRWERLIEEETDDPWFEPSPLESGYQGEGYLLDRCTRRGKRIGALYNLQVVGPITNSDAIPPDLPAYQDQILQIEAIDKEQTRVQFRWIGPAPE